MYLDKIKSPEDVKKLNLKEKKLLAEEIRTALTEKLSRHGGHAGPNYGSTEAIIALHSVFNAPEDKIIFDVSHRSYPHKMLTGRAQVFWIRRIMMMSADIRIRMKANTTCLIWAIPHHPSLWLKVLPKQEICWAEKKM